MSVSGTQTLSSSQPQRNSRRMFKRVDMWPSMIALTDEDRGVTALHQIVTVPAGGMFLIRRRDQASALDEAAGIATKAAQKGVLVSVSLSTPPESLPADAVHIPERALKNWRRVDLARLNPSFVSASAHGWSGIRKAAILGVDAILLSPVFATKSHAIGKNLGLFGFAALVRAAPMPVYALGGMTVARGKRTASIGAIGIAGIGLFAEPVKAD